LPQFGDGLLEIPHIDLSVVVYILGTLAGMLRKYLGRNGLDVANIQEAVGVDVGTLCY
jgi:hypothetical protein